MSKIEPYTIEDIKELVETFGLPEMLEPGIPPNWPERRYSRLILAYAHERAEKNLIVWLNKRAGSTYDRMSWRQIDWLNEVLDEISWPKDKR